MYPSEFLFWSVFPADYSVPVFLMTLTAYTILGRVLLAVLHFCSVRSLAGLFLAGAIYGWTAEGVVVAHHDRICDGEPGRAAFDLVRGAHPYLSHARQDTGRPGRGRAVRGPKG